MSGLDLPCTAVEARWPCASLPYWARFHRRRVCRSGARRQQFDGGDLRAFFAWLRLLAVKKSSLTWVILIANRERLLALARGLGSSEYGHYLRALAGDP
jgi:hypothetical protein